MGTLLNDIQVRRYDASGNLQHVIQVPVNYGPRDKFLAAIDAKVGEYPGRPQAITLPRISFEIENIVYDGNRKKPAQQMLVSEIEGENNKMARQWVPNPYDIIFNVGIMAKNSVDGLQIVEQILPMFVPDFSAPLELIEGGKAWDVPVILDKTFLQDIYKDAFVDDQRVITWNLTFTIKGYYFGPVVEKPIIKFMTINWKVEDANNEPFAINTIMPGLTANGEPTSNAAASVHWNYINVNDDFGYIETIDTGPFEDE